MVRRALALLAVGASILLATIPARAAAQMVNKVTSTTYTVQNSDCNVNGNALLTMNNAAGVQVVLPQAGSANRFPSGCTIHVQNIGSGNVTITPNISTINGLTSITLATNAWALVSNDALPPGTGNYYASIGYGTASGGPAAAGSLTGTTLAPNVVNSSLLTLGGGTVGTAAFYSIGNAGATVPLNNGSNNWSNPNIFSSTVAVTGLLTLENVSVINTNTTLSGGSGKGSGISSIFSSGFWSGTATGFSPYNLTIGSDEVDVTGVNGGIGLYYQYNWGGGAYAGPRSAMTIQMHQTGAVTSSPCCIQQVGLQVDMHANYNAQGTSPSSPEGQLYGFNPTLSIGNGATWWTSILPYGEGDYNVIGANQLYTITGSPTNSDQLQMTFTGSSVSGSPVTVPYIVGTGNTTTAMAAGWCAAIEGTSALSTENISCLVSGNTITIYWPIDQALTLATNVTGSATEIVTAGASGSGGSIWQKIGLHIAPQGDTVPGYLGQDFGVLIGGLLTPTAGLNYGFAVGTSWPIAASGTIIGTPLDLFANTRGYQQPPYVATSGIDFSRVNFSNQSGYSLKMPGATLGGTGTLALGCSTLTPGSSGLSINSQGWIGSGNATISNGGGGGAGTSVNNYFVGDQVYDGLGGQHFVSGVNNSTGAVTSVTTAVEPCTSSGTEPSTTQAATGGSGHNLSLTIDWVPLTTLSLQPSGGTTTISNNAVTFGVSASSTSTIASGGTGYTVGDALTLNGGTGCSTQPILIVQAVSAGVVSYYNVGNPGICTYTPANPVGVSSTTGSGTGATFTLSWTQTQGGGLISPTIQQNGGNLFLNGTGAPWYSGTESILAGQRAGFLIGSGNFNNIIGDDAAGSGNGCASVPIYVGASTVLGTDALRNTCGNARVTLMGEGVMINYAQAGTASNNYAWGNTAFGASALAHWNAAVAFPYNTAIGDTACRGATSGTIQFSGITCVGASTGYQLTSATNGVIISGGTNANTGSTTIATGSDFILIGSGQNAVDTPSSSTSHYININNVWTVTGINSPSTSVSTFPGLVNIGATFGLTPATWTDTQTCTAGQISVDASYVYVCTASNTVKRAALSTF